MTLQATSIPVAILGSGNIGSDLMFKIRRNPFLDLRLVAGVDPASEGLALARSLGYKTSTDGVAAILREPEVKVVFEATSARVHRTNAPLFHEAGITAIDLTPAKVGPSVVPCVNLESLQNAPNMNLISCAAQATVPIVFAISQLSRIKYAEIVATISSESAGPGTRQNIEEFTLTTQKALRELGGADQAKAMVVINPAKPSIVMRNTVYVQPEHDIADEDVRDAVAKIANKVQSYVPGYKVVVDPFRRGDHFMVGLEVEGAGDFLPSYSGNLDIITAAAVAVAEQVAKRKNH
ncbi:putative membrane protein (plasmid) [Caballeronia cordobensis]|nr:putative membrane protein [Burkholderia sp. RPE67]